MFFKPAGIPLRQMAAGGRKPPYVDDLLQWLKGMDPDQIQLLDKLDEAYVSPQPVLKDVNCLSFDGVSGEVIGPAVVLGDSFQVDFTVNIDSTFDGYWTLLGNILNSSVQGGFLIEHRGALQDLTFFVYPNGGVREWHYFDYTAYNDDQFHDYRFTYDNGAFSIYVDDMSTPVDSGNLSSAGSFTDSRVFTIGRGTGAALFSKMECSHCALDGEFDYTFEEGSGTTAYDVSGNENHGTISGATWTKNSDYVSSDGTAQRIDTGIPVQPNTDRIELVARFLGDGSGDALMGSYETDKRIYIGKSGNDKWRLGLGTIATGDSSVSGDNAFHTFAYEAGKLYLDGVEISDKSAELPFTSTVNFILFAAYNGAGYAAHAESDIASYRHWSDGALVRDMIPISGGRFYDKVNGVIYSNAGPETLTTTFVDPIPSWNHSEGFGKQVPFNGTTAYGQVPYDPSINVSNLTILVRARVANATTGVLATRGSPLDGAGRYNIVTFPQNDNIAYYDYGLGYVYSDAVFADAPNNWVVYGLTIDRVSYDLEFYKDGAPAGSKSISYNGRPNESDTSDLFLMKRDAVTTQSTKGDLDWIKVYDAVLTQEEVATVSNGGTISTEPILALESKYANETTFPDTSGNGNDALLVNTSTVLVPALADDASEYNAYTKWLIEQAKTPLPAGSHSTAQSWDPVASASRSVLVDAGWILDDAGVDPSLLGPNLIADPDFNTGAGWTETGASVLNPSEMVVQGDGVVLSAITNDTIVLEVGKVYQVTIDRVIDLDEGSVEVIGGNLIPHPSTRAGLILHVTFEAVSTTFGVRAAMDGTTCYKRFRYMQLNEVL